jgi:hypothetical protein
MWKKIRITILLLILATVALDAWRAHRAVTDWRDTLHVAVYPINGDGSAEAAHTIARLGDGSFADVQAFIESEAQRYGVATLKPVSIRVQPMLSSLPPQAPKGAGMFGAIVWSLELRFWAWRQPVSSPRAHVRLFVSYYGARTERVPNSHGLQQGQIGLVNLYARNDMARDNQVVLAHELLHTLGATDKYDPASLQPRFPDGYAEPGANPRLPQRFCELMAGRIPLGADQAEQPRSLDQCLIGALTAKEIGLAR